MENKNRIKVVLFAMLLLSGCGEKNEEAIPKNEFNFMEMSNSEAQTKDILGISDSEELLDAFLSNEIPAIYDSGDEVKFDQLPQDDEEIWLNYSVGERVDLDNDGENEQVINGPYGGIFLDARDQKVYVFAKGLGTGGILSYTNYDDAVWIVYSDTLHGGRQVFLLKRYNGGENIVDEICLAAEYWDSSDGMYDENSDFTFREEKISMEAYEALRKEFWVVER